mgnify:FL=1|tara:strand:+ start:424215 stop:424649 length:435 start_codon:yes stop_codon:yes gene_type:complete
MQKECEYDEIVEFIDIADKLVAKYPDEFGDIDLATVACVGITNKTRSDKKKQFWDIKPVKQPLARYCNKRYVVVFYMHDWDEWDDIRRAAITADVLCSIPPGGNGEVTAMDYKDHGIMLRTLGVDYMENEQLPNILDEDVEWRK